MKFINNYIEWQHDEVQVDVVLAIPLRYMESDSKLNFRVLVRESLAQKFPTPCLQVRDKSTVLRGLQPLVL